MTFVSPPAANLSLLYQNVRTPMVVQESELVVEQAMARPLSRHPRTVPTSRSSKPMAKCCSVEESNR
jgi:hypothetical protein